MEQILALGKQQQLALLMRSIAVIAGIFQLLFGDKIIAISIFVSVAAISLPSLFSRGHIKSLPIEFELIFIFIVMLQFVIGETLGFYDLVPFYDRFVHFSLPLFIGFISFMIAYTLHETGNLNITTAPLMFVIVFITLGIGALWEIAEYLSDTLLHANLSWIQHLQGSVVETAHVDTMRDLVVDMLGGIVGALLGLRYINTRSSNLEARMRRLVNEISASFKP